MVFSRGTRRYSWSEARNPLSAFLSQGSTGECKNPGEFFYPRVQHKLRKAWVRKEESSYGDTVRGDKGPSCFLGFYPTHDFQRTNGGKYTWLKLCKQPPLTVWLTGISVRSICLGESPWLTPTGTSLSDVLFVFLTQMHQGRGSLGEEVSDVDIEG